MAGIWWLASYPKSGNTWMRAFLSSLLAGRPVDLDGLIGGIASSRSAFDEVLGLESGDLGWDQEEALRPRLYEAWAEEAATPPFCKVHDRYHFTPAGEPLFPTAVTLGAVYIVRNPLAVAPSLARHLGYPLDDAIALMNDPDGQLAGSPDRMALQLRQRLGSWSDHVASWLAAPFPVHAVRYEDLLAAPLETFAAVAAFLGLESAPQAVAAAVAAASFERLRALEDSGGFRERSRHAERFFRQGAGDGWRSELSVEQAGRLLAVHGDMLRRLGYARNACQRVGDAISCPVLDTTPCRQHDD